MPGLFQDGQINNKRPERDSDSRRSLARFEDAERKILERKIAVDRHINERSKRHNEMLSLRTFAENPSAG
jgi:hypothetical protein